MTSTKKNIPKKVLHVRFPLIISTREVENTIKAVQAGKIPIIVAKR